MRMRLALMPTAFHKMLSTLVQRILSCRSKLCCFLRSIRRMLSVLHPRYRHLNKPQMTVQDTMTPI